MPQSTKRESSIGSLFFEERSELKPLIQDTTKLSMLQSQEEVPQKMTYKTDQITAVCFMLTGALSMPLMSMLIKVSGNLSDGQVSTWQVMFWRGMGAMLISYFLCRRWNVDVWEVPSNMRRFWLCRQVLGVLA